MLTCSQFRPPTQTMILLQLVVRVQNRYHIKSHSRRDRERPVDAQWSRGVVRSVVEGGARPLQPTGSIYEAQNGRHVRPSPLLV